MIDKQSGKLGGYCIMEAGQDPPPRRPRESFFCIFSLLTKWNSTPATIYLIIDVIIAVCVPLTVTSTNSPWQFCPTVSLPLPLPSPLASLIVNDSSFALGGMLLFLRFLLFRAGFRPPISPDSPSCALSA
ncbi:hypothetical protein AWENTII_001729 [Aspergillus wentii]